MNNIKKARVASGYTQKQLADILNVTRSTISMWEIGASEPDNDTLVSLCNTLHSSADYLLGRSDTQTSNSVKIPVLGDVRAGIPLLAAENIIDWEEIPAELANSGEYFALRVVGDSMLPRVCAGDVVIVRQQPEVESGEMAIVLINGDSATLKKVVLNSDGSLVLVALNPAIYTPHIYTKKQISDLPVQIIGKVVELRGKL